MIKDDSRHRSATLTAPALQELNRTEKSSIGRRLLILMRDERR